MEYSPQIIKKTLERDKTFITVGRLGTTEKATELLLRAFANTKDRHTWNLKLVGPVEDSFKEEIKKL